MGPIGYMNIADDCFWTPSVTIVLDQCYGLGSGMIGFDPLDGKRTTICRAINGPAAGINERGRWAPENNREAHMTRARDNIPAG
jgi:hypothetical protein